MIGVMERLRLPIPQFEMKRYARLDLSESSGFKLQGIQADGSPFDIFKSVKDRAWRLSFHANYGEPDLEVEVSASAQQTLQDALKRSPGSFLAIELRYDTSKH